MRQRVMAGVVAALLLAVVSAAPSPAAQQEAQQPGHADDRAGFVEAPQRYLDEVFPDIVTTGSIPFATVTNYEGKEQTLLLDLTQPVTDGQALRPATVWLGGGSFKTLRRSSMANWTNRSARRGYVAVTIDYRVRPDLDMSTGEGLYDAMIDAMHDAQAAIRWLRANAETYRIDPERISIGGYSAGGVTSMFVNFGAEQAEVDGPNPGYPSHVSASVSLAGALGAKPVLGDPPIIMFHGEKDVTVPYLLAVLKCDLQIAAGNICEPHWFPNHAHGLPWDTIYPLAFDFLYRHVSCGDRFSDVAPLPHLFCSDIDWMVTNGLAHGFPDATFRPTMQLSRQHLASMLWHLMGAPAPAGPAPFPDVSPASPFADAIAWAAEAGVISGYADGSFKPTAPVTRQAAVAMLWALMGRPAPTTLPPPFSDVGADHVFAQPIAWAVEAGVAEGFVDGTFGPTLPTVRQGIAPQLRGVAELLP